MANMLNYLLRHLYLLSVILNVVTGGRCRHTFSERTALMARQGKPWALFMRGVIDWLFFWVDDHCESAVGFDEYE